MMHREKLRDAHRHLERVAAVEKGYFDGQPFRLVHRYDPRAAAYRVRVEVRVPMPSDLAPLVTDLLRDLRGALDAMATALASREGAAARAVRFPIHDSLPQFAQRSRHALATMPDEAQATIEALQPYHTFGGFHLDLLWLLRELGATDAPRLAAGSIRDDSTLGVNTQRDVEIAGALAVIAGPFESGALLASVAARVAGPDPKLDLHLRAQFELAFATDGPARGAPLVRTLAAMSDQVSAVIAALG